MWYSLSLLKAKSFLAASSSAYLHFDNLDAACPAGLHPHLCPPSHRKPLSCSQCRLTAHKPGKFDSIAFRQRFSAPNKVRNVSTRNTKLQCTQSLRSGRFARFPLPRPEISQSFSFSVRKMFSRNPFFAKNKISQSFSSGISENLWKFKMCKCITNLEAANRVRRQ